MWVHLYGDKHIMYYFLLTLQVSEYIKKEEEARNARVRISLSLSLSLSLSPPFLTYLCSYPHVSVQTLGDLLLDLADVGGLEVQLYAVAIDLYGIFFYV